jgi:hypothetical protein
MVFERGERGGFGNFGGGEIVAMSVSQLLQLGEIRLGFAVIIPNLGIKSRKSGKK